MPWGKVGREVVPRRCRVSGSAVFLLAGWPHNCGFPLWVSLFSGQISPDSLFQLLFIFMSTMRVSGIMLHNECVADIWNRSEYEKQMVTVYDNLTSERDQFLELERRTELLQQRLDALSKNHTELLKMLQGNWTPVIFAEIQGIAQVYQKKRKETQGHFFICPLHLVLCFRSSVSIFKLCSILFLF